MHELILLAIICVFLALGLGASLVAYILNLHFEKKQLREERDRAQDELRRVQAQIHPAMRVLDRPVVTAGKIADIHRERHKPAECGPAKEPSSAIRKGGWTATRDRLEYESDPDRKIEKVLKAHEGVAL